mmetsp:Transcript_24863/g.62965  ORF Transcript_24863/g.62965 Transcript_24863/m.62965 type:complete len:430 (-) Transcript_24863:978-2267(-)
MIWSSCMASTRMFAVAPRLSSRKHLRSSLMSAWNCTAASPCIATISAALVALSTASSLSPLRVFRSFFKPSLSNCKTFSSNSRLLSSIFKLSSAEWLSNGKEGSCAEASLRSFSLSKSARTFSSSLCNASKFCVCANAKRCPSPTSSLSALTALAACASSVRACSSSEVSIVSALLAESCPPASSRARSSRIRRSASAARFCAICNCPRSNSTPSSLSFRIRSATSAVSFACACCSRLPKPRVPSSALAPSRTARRESASVFKAESSTSASCARASPLTARSVCLRSAGIKVASALQSSAARSEHSASIRKSPPAMPSIPVFLRRSASLASRCKFSAASSFSVAVVAAACASSTSSLNWAVATFVAAAAAFSSRAGSPASRAARSVRRVSASERDLFNCEVRSSTLLPPAFADARSRCIFLSSTLAVSS